MLGGLLLLCISNTILSSQGAGLIEVFKWKQIEFANCGQTHSSNRPVVFPGSASRYGEIIMQDTYSTDRCTLNTTYVPYNNVPIGVTHHQGRLIVTVPRRREGIPATLNFIDMRANIRNPSPTLQPYPNFETNQYIGKQNGLVSVYRTSVDVCQRLWFVDTGNLEYPGNFQQIQPASIWIIDLTTNRLVRRFEILTNIVSVARGLASITIDIASTQRCDAAYAYIPDLINSKLYVYSFAENRIWGFSHDSFLFDPSAGNVTVAGQNFRWNDGIFSIALGAVLPDGSRNLYYHPMQSNNEFIVSNRYVQNALNAGTQQSNAYQLLGSRGTRKHSTRHAYDPKTGVIFYSEVNRNGVGCWNTKRPFSAANHGIVAANDATMIYPSDLTIDETGTIWILTNSMPIFVYSQLDTSVYNFRIWKQNTHVAIQNTICE